MGRSNSFASNVVLQKAGKCGMSAGLSCCETIEMAHSIDIDNMAVGFWLFSDFRRALGRCWLAARHDGSMRVLVLAREIFAALHLCFETVIPKCLTQRKGSDASYV